MRALVASALLTVFAACNDTRPARVLDPERYGLICTAQLVCIDDLSRLNEAVALRQEAAAFVTRTLGPFRTQPRVLFCATEACYAQFADVRTRGINFGTRGAVIGPRGWRDYIVRHELIHHLQNERFGELRTATLPGWYVEGMAYSLSADPRRPLPGDDIERWRAQYEAWIAAGNTWQVPPN